MTIHKNAAGGRHPQAAQSFQTCTIHRPVESLLERLDGIKQTGPDRWVAKCPAHDDRSPSLGIRELDDRRILLRCWAGCSTEVVLDAVGLTFTDLFPSDLNGRDIGPTRPYRKPPRFRTAEVLELAIREATVCAIALSVVLAGEPFSAEDAERVVRALETLFALKREVGHGL